MLEVSNYFNRICERTLIQCPDLLKGYSNNESLIYYPVDIDFIKPDFTFKNKDKLVVAHYPSTESTKGSDIIIPVLMNVHMYLYILRLTQILFQME